MCAVWSLSVFELPKGQGLQRWMLLLCLNGKRLPFGNARQSRRIQLKLALSKAPQRQLGKVTYKFDWRGSDRSDAPSGFITSMP